MQALYRDARSLCIRCAAVRLKARFKWSIERFELSTLPGALFPSFVVCMSALPLDFNQFRNVTVEQCLAGVASEL